MAKKQTVEETAPEGVSGSGTENLLDVEAPLSDAPYHDADGLEASIVTPSAFEPEALRATYRTMLLSRRLDEKMLNLLKQGKGFFHIGCAGHEAVQVALGDLARPGHDWFSYYYRDLCNYLSIGASTRDILLLHLAKADDPNSGGRQMAEHFSNPELNVLPMSSSVGSQFLPAVGAAMGIQRKGQDAFALASCGDGATSQGAFHEAMNWAARDKAPVLFLVQDNGYAISVPTREQTAGGSSYGFARGYDGMARAHVDGTDYFKSYATLKAAVDHIRAGNGPVCVVADVVRLLPHSSSDNHAKYRTPEELDQDQQIDPISRMEVQLVEAGVLTQDAIDDLRADVKNEVDEAAAWAMEQADPTPDTATRHVFFEGDLGLSYEASEPSGEPIVMVDAINHALSEEMERNERVVVYGEDVAGGKGGVFTATRDLTKRFGKDRCFNSQLAENSIIGTAVGFSAAGYKPVVEIQFGDYIWPSMQHLRNAVSTLRYRSNGRWGCPMVIRVPVGGYIHGGLCHSQNIEAIFGHMPGFKIALPATAADAKGLLKSAIRMEDPVLFLEHKALYRSAAARSPEPDAEYLLPFGKARVAREGTDLTIVTYGAILHKALNVAKTLEKEGASVEVIDLRTIVPVDMDTVLASVEKTNRVLVAYEDHEFLGFGAEISAQIADKAFHHLDAPVRRLAGAFSPIPFADPLEKAVLPQDDDVLEAAREILSF